MTQDNGARALSERIDLALVPYRDPDGGIHVDDPADMPHFIERLSRAFLPDAAELERLRRIEAAARDVVRPAKGIGREARSAVFNERLAALRVALDLSKLDYPKHYDHRRGCSRTHPATFPCDTGTPTAATIAFRAALQPEGSAGTRKADPEFCDHCGGQYSDMAGHMAHEHAAEGSARDG